MQSLAYGSGLNNFIVAIPHQDYGGLSVSAEFQSTYATIRQIQSLISQALASQVLNFLSI